MLLARFNSDGSLDNTFGEGGCVKTLVGSQDVVRGIAVYPSSSLYAGDIVAIADAVIMSKTRRGRPV